MKTMLRKTISTFLLVAVLFSMMQFGSVSSFAADSDFTVSNGVLIKYNGSVRCVRIPSTVTTIGANAFNGAVMEEILIPSSVTTIERYAFEQCVGLTKVTVPESVTTIGNYAFDQCTSLKSITLSSKIKAIGIGTFKECTSLEKITIPDDVTSIGKYAFQGCTNLKSAVISSNAKTLGIEIFDDCGKLTISGYDNTAIKTYASNNGISFKSLGLGSFTLDTTNRVIAPKGSYTIGAKLIGTGLTVRAYSSKSNVAKLERLSSKEYKVTGIKAGTTYIMFNVYDKNNKQVGHASVKIVVRWGAISNAKASSQVDKF